MWLIKANETKYGKLTGTLYGIQFKNGLANIDRYYDYHHLTRVEDFTDISPPSYKDLIKPLKNILINLPGGLGDSLFITPLLRGIKAKYGSDCKITVYTTDNGISVLRNSPYISGFIGYPAMNMEKTHDDYDDIFELGCSIENNPVAEMENAYKVTCDLFDIVPPNKDYCPEIFLTEEETKKAKRVVLSLTKMKDVKIGVQLDSTSPLRVFPKSKVKEFLSKLSELGQVFVFGKDRESLRKESYKCSACNHEDIYSVSDGTKKAHIECSKCSGEVVVERSPENPRIHEIIGLDVRAAMSICNEMDYFVGIDSGFLHIAAALQKPILALFTNFAGELRTKFFKNTLTYNEPFRCAPCHLNSVNVCPEMNRSGLKEPPCATNLNVSKIISLFTKILENNGQDFESIHLNRPKIEIKRDSCYFCRHKESKMIARKGFSTYALCSSCESIYYQGELPLEAYNDPNYHNIQKSDKYIAQAMIDSRVLCKRLHLNPNQSILEIGCATGAGLMGFYEAGHNVHGLEYNETIMDTIPNLAYRSKLVKGDLMTFSPESGYDVILMQDTFEHFNDPAGVFQKVGTLLNPGGLFVIIGPSASAMSSFNFSKNSQLNTMYPGEHQFIPSQKAIRALSSMFGMTIVSYVDSREYSAMEAIMQK